jgi:hypothetical protein
MVWDLGLIGKRGSAASFSVFVSISQRVYTIPQVSSYCNMQAVSLIPDLVSEIFRVFYKPCTEERTNGKLSSASEKKLPTLRTAA